LLPYLSQKEGRKKGRIPPSVNSKRKEEEGKKSLLQQQKKGGENGRSAVGSGGGNKITKKEEGGEGLSAPRRWREKEKEKRGGFSSNYLHVKETQKEPIICIGGKKKKGEEKNALETEKKTTQKPREGRAPLRLKKNGTTHASFDGGGKS